MIIVYDIEQKRVSKVCKYLRRYMNWVQNSVFEGEITPAKKMEIQMGLKKKIKKDIDSILFFSVRSKKLLKKEIMGVDKNPTEIFI